MRLLLAKGARTDIQLAGITWGRIDLETTFFDVTPFLYAQMDSCRKFIAKKSTSTPTSNACSKPRVGRFRRSATFLTDTSGPSHAGNSLLQSLRGSVATKILSFPERCGGRRFVRFELGQINCHPSLPR